MELKVHYRVQKSPPLIPIPVHTFLQYFPKIHSNIIACAFRMVS